MSGAKDAIGCECESAACAHKPGGGCKAPVIGKYDVAGLQNQRLCAHCLKEARKFARSIGGEVRPIVGSVAKDRRARLHRALDRVLDRRAARDEEDEFERRAKLATPGAHVILESGYGAKGGNTGNDFIRLTADAGARVVERRGSDIWVDLDTPHKYGKRWKFPIMAIKPR